MAYSSVQNGTTQFLIDWDVIRRILKSYWTAKLQYDYGSDVSMSDTHWWNPMSWSLPDVSHIEVDWKRVRQDAEKYADRDVKIYNAFAERDAAMVARKLEEQIGQAGEFKKAFLQWMRAIQDQNASNIERSIDDYENKVAAAKIVRDLAGDGLMVGATILSGGAAAGIEGIGTLVLGSVYKGCAKYQDTSSVGAAVMEGSGELIFAYFKLGKTFSLKEDVIIAVVQGIWKGSTELVGGASVKESLLKGGLKTTGPFVDRLFKTAPAKYVFEKVAVPIEITYKGENYSTEVLSKFAKAGVNAAIKNVAVQAIKSSASGTGAMSSSSDSGARGKLIDDATLTNDLLLKFAFVNMDRGIGRGW